MTKAIPATDGRYLWAKRAHEAGWLSPAQWSKIASQLVEEENMECAACLQRMKCTHEAEHHVRSTGHHSFKTKNGSTLSIG